jgi:hypothetical protein
MHACACSLHAYIYALHAYKQTNVCIQTNKRAHTYMHTCTNAFVMGKVHIFHFWSKPNKYSYIHTYTHTYTLNTQTHYQERCPFRFGQTSTHVQTYIHTRTHRQTNMHTQTHCQGRYLFRFSYTHTHTHTYIPYIYRRICNGRRPFPLWSKLLGRDCNGYQRRAGE